MYFSLNPEENLKMLLVSIILLPIAFVIDLIIKKVKEKKDKRKRG